MKQQQQPTTIRTNIEFDSEQWQLAKELAHDLDAKPTTILKVLLRLWVKGQLALTIADLRPK